jgi:ribosomal protein S8
VLSAWLPEIKNDKMKRILIVYIPVILLLISCQNSSEPSTDSNENIQNSEEVKDLFYYMEFVDFENTNNSRNIIEQLKNELYSNGYIATTETNEWQGIRKVNKEELITLKDMDKYQTYIHKFKDISEYNPKNGDLEKIVITLNKPINDTIPNFNYHSYNKRGFKEWQSLKNPGNFRYTEGIPFTESELRNWMINLIIILTFK